MLLSLGMVFLAGFLGGKVADSLKMPRLLAYLLAGMALGHLVLIYWSRL
ncbi:hypothetical protein R0V13_00670 [Facklamia hominis]|nr:hypothetical protein [Facklamia hominis]WPJ90944.1 hypothetical protein R0V13_00670 [Facklamia hominis]